MSTDTSVHAKICALRADLATNLIDRADAIDAAILALVTREHTLFLGPPGTAKSMLVRSVCERIEGTSYFEQLLTRFSTPEELSGPLSLSALENDRYERVTADPRERASLPRVRHGAHLGAVGLYRDVGPARDVEGRDHRRRRLEHSGRPHLVPLR